MNFSTNSVGPISKYAVDQTAGDRRSFHRLSGAARSVLGAEWHQSSEVRARIYRAGDAWLKRMAQLRRAQGRSRTAQRDLAWLVLGSLSGRLAACLLSSAAKKEKLTFAQIEERALSLNARVGVKEPVRVFKKKGEKRILTEFGPKRSALQWMVRDVLTALKPISETEYAAKGKGRDAAVCRLRDELNQGDHRELVLADVKGCFPSIRIDKVCGLLPLPRAVISGIVFVGQEESVELGIGLQSLAAAVNTALREGLPQGSFLSPLVASYVMSSLLASSPCLAHGLSYVDDLGVRADSKEHGQAIKQALQHGASAHFPGRSSFKRLDAVLLNSTSKKAHYLGYQFRVGMDGNIRITPTARAIYNFVKRVIARLKTAKHSEMHDVVGSMACSFRASQSAWDYTEDAAAVFEAQLETEISAEKARRSLKKQMQVLKSGTIPYGLAALSGHI